MYCILCNVKQKIGIKEKYFYDEGTKDFLFFIFDFRFEEEETAEGGEMYNVQ
jgi:hypothetical protein